MSNFTKFVPSSTQDEIEEIENIEFIINSLLLNNSYATIFDIVYYIFFTKDAIDAGFELAISPLDLESRLTILPPISLEHTSLINKLGANSLQYPTPKEEVQILKYVSQLEKENHYIPFVETDKLHSIQIDYLKQIDNLALSVEDRKLIYGTNLEIPVTIDNECLLNMLDTLENKLFSRWSYYLCKTFDTLVQYYIDCYAISSTLAYTIIKIQKILTEYCDYESYGKYLDFVIINSEDTTVNYELDLMPYSYLIVEDTALFIVFKPITLF